MTTFGPNGDTIPGNPNATGSIGVGAGAPNKLGFVNFAGDRDWYRVTLVAGVAYDFQLNGVAGAGMLADPILRLHSSAAGNPVVAIDNNGGAGNNAFINNFIAPAGGTYWLDAGGVGNGTGHYALIA
jgi:serralysin